MARLSDDERCDCPSPTPHRGRPHRRRLRPRRDGL